MRDTPINVIQHLLQCKINPRPEGSSIQDLLVKKTTLVNRPVIGEVSGHKPVDIIIIRQFTERTETKLTIRKKA